MAHPLLIIEGRGSTQVDASGLMLSGPSSAVNGAIGAVGDKDLFKLFVASNSVLRLETFNGAGNDCPAGIATALRLFNSAGVQLYTDTNSGIGACSELLVNAPAGTYYVQVEQVNNASVIPSYRLEVKIQASKGAEAEPNDLQAISNALAGSDVVISGGHQVNADADFFAITVPAGKSIRAETLEGGAETCEGLDVDSRLTLFNAAAALLVDDDDNGRGYCSAIDGTGAASAYPGAHGLAAGTYYLMVRASSFSQMGTAGQFDYKLALTIR